MLKGHLKLQHEIDSVVEDDSDVIWILNSPKSSKNNQSDESETHLKENEYSRDGEPFPIMSEPLEICLKGLEELPVKHERCVNWELRGEHVEMSDKERWYAHTSAGEETLYYMNTVPERRARRDK